MKKTLPIFGCFIAMVLIGSCSETKSDAEKEIEEWLANSDQRDAEIRANNNLVDSSIHLISKLRVDSSCNHQSIAVLFKPLTQNRDSLLKAARIINDETAVRMIENPDCSAKDVLIFFYDSQANYQKGAWFMKSSSHGIQPASSEIGYYYK